MWGVCEISLSTVGLMNKDELTILRERVKQVEKNICNPNTIRRRFKNRWENKMLLWP
jgi:hypothetical protein